ncbi:unnamed protein product [Symbiodinium pilosum]|uniref:Glycoside hydrolase family 5 domain-containing protein n=1 Tax=Symbiodinium pilosum TaxID=2952 RepID=A0A812MMQ7_SYMPI|nr:unnamed protein product [Symbiodinium pilosum]
MEMLVNNGLNVRSLSEIATKIVNLQFNCVRLPYSLDSLNLTAASIPNPASQLCHNPELQASTPLEIFDSTVQALTDAGLLVVLNNHVSQRGWCCAASDGEGLWYTEEFPESVWLQHLGFLAARYRDNPKVIGFDIRNEIRSTEFDTPTWGEGTTDWALAASKGSRQVLDANPDMLLFISGLEYSMFLCGVPQHPLHLEQGLEGHIIYTTHEYEWYTNSPVTALPGDEDKQTSPTSPEHVVGAEDGVELSELNKVVEGDGPRNMNAVADQGKDHPQPGLNRQLVAVIVLAMLLMICANAAAFVYLSSYEAWQQTVDDRWGFLLHEESDAEGADVAAVWLGEFGTATDTTWWKHMLRYLSSRPVVGWAYWPLNETAHDNVKASLEAGRSSDADCNTTEPPRVLQQDCSFTIKALPHLDTVASGFIKRAADMYSWLFDKKNIMNPEVLDVLVSEVRSWEEIDKNLSHGAMDILEDPWQCINLTNAHLNGMAATAFTGDRVGAREVIHRLPAEGNSTATQNGYQQYIGLQEWENIKASVANEVIPTRKFHMSDYKLTEAAEKPRSVERPRGLEVSAAAAPASGELQLNSLSGKRSPRDASPKVDALQLWLEAKEQALQCPSMPIAIPNHSPRQRPTRAVAKLICASPALQGGPEESLAVQVNTVNPTNLTPRRRDGPSRAPQIRDKEREKYPSGKIMRPVRKANADSWQKLTEVLESPGRIDAKESHPSRSFNVVPKTNLRVV